MPGVGVSGDLSVSSPVEPSASDPRRSAGSFGLASPCTIPKRDPTGRPAFSCASPATASGRAGPFEAAAASLVCER